MCGDGVNPLRVRATVHAHIPFYYPVRTNDGGFSWDPPFLNGLDMILTAKFIINFCEDEKDLKHQKLPQFLNLTFCPYRDQ